MPDYIYLLANRLTADQRNAIEMVRQVARDAGVPHFLTGDVVRDLTSGHAVHDLEIAVQCNALKLKKTLEKHGAQVWGEDEASRTLYLCFPGTVRLDLVSTHSTEFPKPGKAVYHPATIHEDLRRRDFTVNAIAISLNDLSFGLLMDPLNGVADTETRTLRLVSNYGFLEDPALLVRATRLMTRLGWEMDPRTQTRYENAKAEGVIEFLSAQARSQELEQIGHEEEALKVLQVLEAEGWLSHLFAAWTPAKADEEKLRALHDLAVDLMLQGVHADVSAAQMELLTAKMNSKDVAALKKQMLRPGFVEEWNSLDSLAAGFAKVLMAKEHAVPSSAYKLFTTYDPEAVLWLGFTSKSAPVQERYRQFLKVWPEARQRTPYAMMLEMRITPELTGYAELIQSIFLQLIDGKLGTEEEMRAFLEPYSPPAPPPQVAIKRPRIKRSAEAKLKERSFEDEEDAEEGAGDEEDLDDIGGEDDGLEIGMGLPKIDEDGSLAIDGEDGGDEEEDEEEEEEASHPVVKPHPGKTGKRQAAEKAPEPKKEKSAKGKLPSQKDKGEQESKVKASAAPAKKKMATGAEKKAPEKPAKAAKPVAKKPAKPAAKPSPKAAPKAKPGKAAGKKKGKKR